MIHGTGSADGCPSLEICHRHLSNQVFIDIKSGSSCVVLLCIFRCEEHCLSCQGPGTSCTQCKDGYSLVSRTCIMNATCNNGTCLQSASSAAVVLHFIHMHQKQTPSGTETQTCNLLVPSPTL